MTIGTYAAIGFMVAVVVTVIAKLDCEGCQGKAAEMGVSVGLTWPVWLIILILAMVVVVPVWIVNKLSELLKGAFER